jgi:hypothetical protein
MPPPHSQAVDQSYAEEQEEPTPIIPEKEVPAVVRKSAPRTTEHAPLLDQPPTTRAESVKQPEADVATTTDGWDTLNLNSPKRSLIAEDVEKILQTKKVSACQLTCVLMCQDQFDLIKFNTPFAPLRSISVKTLWEEAAKKQQEGENEPSSMPQSSERKQENTNDALMVSDITKELDSMMNYFKKVKGGKCKEQYQTNGKTSRRCRITCPRLWRRSRTGPSSMRSLASRPRANWTPGSQSKVPVAPPSASVWRAPNVDVGLSRVD